MSRLILSVLIFLFPSDSYTQDLLLDYMRYNWVSEVKQDIKEEADLSSIPDDTEAEAYSWELGSPDNIPETVIIYELKSDCY